jgi:hypothetical protein
VTESNVSLTASGATDGTTYEYELSDPAGTSDFTIELTGVETTDLDTVSEDLTPTERWDPEISGDVRPTGPSGVGNPVIELTARAHSWNTGYTASDGTTGVLFSENYYSEHTIHSVTANQEIHQLTIGGLASRRGGCAIVYVNEDGQNGAFGEGTRVASNFCPSDTGPQTIDFSTPYTTETDSVTVEFVQTIGGPVRVPLANVSAEEDGYRNNREGDSGNYVANLSVSTSTPTNVSVTDSAGDRASFGSLGDNETASRQMLLTTNDVLTVNFDPNGADLRGTIRYLERSRSRNVSVTVNGNRTAHAGTLAPGETVSVPADTAWLRSGTNTVTVGVQSTSEDAPERAVDVRYRHDLDPSATVANDTTAASSTPASPASPSDGDVVVTDVSFTQETIQSSGTAVVVVTVRNTRPTAATRLVELELFDQVVNSREVTVAANDEATVRFVHTIVAPGTYTARVDNETATVRVIGPESTPPPTSTTSTDFPGFGGPVTTAALLAALVGAALLARRD